MELTVAGRDWHVEVADPRATLADLAAACGLAAGALGPPSTPLSVCGAARGADLAADDTAAPAPAAPARAPIAEVAAVGGLDAGRRAVAGPGRVVIGRAGDGAFSPTDATVSRRHAELVVAPDGTVALADLGSRNGTWLVTDGDEVAVGPGAVELAPPFRLRLGALDVAVAAPTADDAPVGRPGAPAALGGAVPFNRPPRPAAPPAPAPVPVPEPPPEAARALPLGVVAVLAPIAMAAVLVVLLDNWVFAALALLSPVVAVGNHLEGRRRTRRLGRRDAARRAADLAAAAAALALAGEVEAVRRCAEVPDPAEVLRRAELPSTRLWERRPGHDDWLRLRVGVGDVPWDPPLAGDRTPRPADVAELVAAGSVLPRCAASVDLGGGGVVGVVGHRTAALAVARSLLCQAAVHHGPADLPVAIACGADAAGAWDWSKWLPHVEDAAGALRRLAAGREAADALAGDLLAAGEGADPLVVVDGDDLLAGRRAPVRSLLARRASGIVVSEAIDRLPAACTAVVVVDDDGGCELRLPALGRRVTGLRAAGMAGDTARRCARALARFDDPELDVAGAGLPDVVRLLPLLDLDRPSAEAVAARWRAAGPDPRPVAPIGLAADGVVDVDLVADGPHGLVAGTTGAGKSELLRTLVAGLAAGASPQHLTFVLVDFKGGSAFDACGRLPHVVGVVTDLDDDLAQRALRCLDAELRHRERLLRASGSSDLAAHRRSAGGGAPLPRLVVIVDEFATLKAELPGFVDALVGVAQRGRSLGVHLVLATQRPSGAVSDQIRANTNLRVALRVQDVADSADVVDRPDAAHLPRARPGRACVRLGPGEVVAVQTALATARRSRSGPAKVRVHPFEFGPGAPAAPPVIAAGGPAGRSDLDLLVDACGAAWAATGLPAPRRPWPDPLPAAVDRASLPPGEAGTAVVAVADDPDGQRRLAAGWRPADGNLAVYGVGGSGTTTTLLAVAVAVAEARGPDLLHLYAVDHGAGELAVLGGLPHTGAVVVAAERERQHRLVRRLRAELDRRRAVPAGERAGLPLVVALVDGVAGFLAEFDDVAGLEVLDAFERVFADGPEVGIHVVLAADRPAAVPSALASLVRQRWVHRLADPIDAGAAGVAGPPPQLPPGRFVDTATGLVAHVGVPAEGWTEAVEACARQWAGVAPSAPPVGELPAAVRRSAVEARASTSSRPWSIPIGVADDDLGPVALPLWEGDHVLVAGPGRSGRTTALATIAAGAVEAGARVLVEAGRRSWLAGVAGVEPFGALPPVTGPTLVLVDDADAVDDPVLDALVAAGDPLLHVVASGHAERLRGLYSHWTRTVRRSRVGVLLRPQLDLDGELLATALPRRVSAPLVAGRGFLVADGAARLIQVATPD